MNKHFKENSNRQLLTLDDDLYSGDDDMTYLIRRLLSAASDTKLRHDMNVEDEFFSAIENRDTAIMARDKKIKEQDSLISEQSNTISEQSNTISEQSNTISEQSNTISEQSNIITEQNDLLKKMATSMLNRGIAIEDIAVAIGKSVESIKQLLNS